MPKYFIASLLMVLGFSGQATAQLGFSHEIGAIVGPVAFQSDYGERHDFKTNAGNTGIGVGLIHYLNFAYRAECNCYAPETFFNDHFKLRSELSFNKTKLNHEGEWADKNNTFGRQLKAMQGETSVTNIGVQLEFFPLSIREFSASPGKLAPFISLGGQFSFYNPKAYSTLGPGKLGDDPTITPVKYFDAFDQEGGTTWSVVGSIGTRYKLTVLSDLMIDLRWQYYFSNWVDGLNPNPDVYKENKANDWLVWLNVGYIYYLD
ncbi:THC0290_0291 family protein [Flavobacterium silvaticum]|uniref:Glutamate dehydrogenase n=1 Tax=Flavobacterium silvaticum TaxID=1852020 RepID=A0A972FJ51_9FLAO|nr:glutamate dehydrogenase [Flavobacterium silvaticum]NMH26627.1 glutamate dehydrogenase [Flavobacterium silvaticum]